MDPEEAPPPPYSAVDPLLTQSNNGGDISTDSHHLSLRGGNAPSQNALARGDPSSSAGDPASASPRLPTNFVSAAAYFTERPPASGDPGRTVLDHHLTIYPRSQSKDFPRRPRCWSSRNNEITQQDWDVFLRYLFPPHLGLASSSGHLPRQLRAEIQRDRKDRPQETDEQRAMRVKLVIAEWNRVFFEPRATRISFVYVTDPERAPASPLCPRCYPAATRASHDTQSSPSPVSRNWQGPYTNVPPTLGNHPTVPPVASPFAPGMYAYPTSPMATPSFPRYGMSPMPPADPHGPRIPPAMPPPPPNFQHCRWGWNNRPYVPSYPNSGSSKSGPMSWISQLASQAQKYGERISEQAEHYSRQVEEQAMAHGRWIEQQAGFGGQNVERFGDAISNFVSGPRYEWPGHNWSQQIYYPNTSTPPNPTLNPALNPAPNPTPATQVVDVTPQTQRPRRSSVSSTSSESSLTSVDSISTTSDLSPSDLATVRAQLLSLNDHHDRELYDTTVGLQRQLDALQQSRRESRFPGRGSWRNGWWHNHPHSHGYGRGGWGRWESPQQQQQNWAERRAMKEEMKATKKAFRDTFRRAREEHREKRRLKRNRKRQERKSRKRRQEEQHEPTQEAPLEQRLGNLELRNTELANHSESQPVIQSAVSRPRSHSAASSAAASEVSIISTPSTTSSEDNTQDDAKSGKGDEASPEGAGKQAKEKHQHGTSESKESNQQQRKNNGNN